MATTVSNNTIALSGAPKGLFADLKVRAAKYFEYRQTLKELSTLTDRDLADMGLGRSFIKRTALEAVYGVKAD